MQDAAGVERGAGELDVVARVEAAHRRPAGGGLGSGGVVGEELFARLCARGELRRQRQPSLRLFAVLPLQLAARCRLQGVPQVVEDRRRGAEAVAQGRRKVGDLLGHVAHREAEDGRAFVAPFEGQLPGQGVQLEEHSPQVAGVFRQTLGGACDFRRIAESPRHGFQAGGRLRQPVDGRPQAHVEREMVAGLLRQMVRFVEHEDRLRRRRQHDAAAEAQVRQHQIVVRHHHIGLGNLSPRLEERALVVVAAASAAATGAVVGGGVPGSRIDAVRPAVQLAVPGTLGEGVLQVLVDRRVFRARQFEEQRFAVHVSPQQVLQTLQTDVTASALGQREAEVQAGMALQVRQIAQHHLFLQRHRGSGDHHALVERLGHRDGRQTVGDGLAGARAGLDDAEPAVVVGEGAGDVGDHLALPTARLEASAGEPRRIGGLDARLQIVREGACARISHRRFAAVGPRPTRMEGTLPQIACAACDAADWSARDSYPTRHLRICPA